MGWEDSFSKMANAHQDDIFRDFPTALEDAFHRSRRAQEGQPAPSEVDVVDAPESVRKRALAKRGTRKSGVFEHVWRWAKTREVDESLAVWQDRCARYAMDTADAIIPTEERSGFSEDEAANIGRKIAHFIYTRWDAYRKFQSARGRASGRSRREPNILRDSRIVAKFLDGMDKAAIARSEGISRGAVQHVIRRFERDGSQERQLEMS